MISIILIHYNGEDFILNAIESVLKYGGISNNELQFIIIDNSQNFDELKLSKLDINYKYVNPGYNAGFARAVNLGFRESTGHYALLMNQDAFLIEKNTLLTLIKTNQQLPNKSIVGCSLKDEMDNFQESVWIDDPGLKREWRTSALNQKINKNWQTTFESKKKEIHSKNGYVHRINGAFLLIPIKDAQNISEIYFDEDFFLYGEDIEWALRIKKKKWKFYHDSNVIVKHLGSASSPNVKTKLMQIIISDWLVLKKNFGVLYLTFYFFLFFTNRMIDKILFLFYKMRNGKYPENLHVEFVENIKTFNYLFKKYSWKIIILRRLSGKTNFILNCYQNDQKNIGKI